MGIKLLKLITGEEIIARHEHDGIKHSLKDVRVVTRLPMANPQGVQFINVLAPYFGGAQRTSNLVLLPEHVVQMVDPDVELLPVYVKDTSSIIVARK